MVFTALKSELKPARAVQQKVGKPRNFHSVYDISAKFPYSILNSHKIIQAKISTFVRNIYPPLEFASETYKQQERHTKPNEVRFALDVPPINRIKNDQLYMGSPSPVAGSGRIVYLTSFVPYHSTTSRFPHGLEGFY